MIGEDGEDGRGISSTVIEYQVGDSGTVAPTGAWSKNIPDTDPGEYLWTRTTFKFTDGSTDIAYSVSMKGLEGKQGDQGIQGPPGDDGKNNYFHVKYMTEDNYNKMLQYKAGHHEYTFVAQNTAAKYIGTNVTENPNSCANDAMEELANDYEWYDIKGIQGEKGLQGDGYYLHIKYMTEANYNLLQQYIKAGDARMHTVEMTEEDEDAKYIGQYVDKYVDGESHEDDSNDPTKYEWSRFKGDSSYFYVKYMSADDYHAYTEHPATANVTLHDDPVDITSHPIFVGIYFSDVNLSAAAKINPVSYRWSQFEGSEGIPGADGNFTHIKYMTAANYDAWVAASRPKAWDKMQETAAEYLGMYTDKTETDSSDPNTYQWTRIQGKDGTSYRLDLSNGYMIRGQDGNVPVSTLTASAYRTSGDSSARMAVQSTFYLYYSTDGKIYTRQSVSSGGITTWTPNLSFLNQSAYLNVTHLKISASETNKEDDIFDYQCIPIVKDGVDGKSNLTMVLSNEYEGIPVKSDGSFFNTPNVRTKVSVAYGLTDVTADAGCEYSAVKSGVVGDWSTTSGREYVITGLTADTGYVDITATYLGASVTRRFSVSKVKYGKDGDVGVNGSTYRIEVSAGAIKRDKAGTISPQTVNVKTYRTDGASAVQNPINAYVFVYTSTDGVAFTKTTYSPTAQSSRTINVSSYITSTTVALQFKASLTNSDSAAFDVQTLPIMVDGKDGVDGKSNLTMVLSNEYEGIPVSVVDNSAVKCNVSTKVTVLLGTQELSVSDISLKAVPSNVKGQLSGLTYTVTEISAPEGYVDITATYQGNSITKRFSLTKIKHGIDGVDGRTYFVETGVDVLKHVDGNQPVMPEVFTVSSYYRDGGTPDKIPYPAYFSVTCSQDGTTFDTVLYESTSKESSKDVSLSMLDVGLDAAIKLLTAIAVRVIVSDKAKPQGLEDALDVKTIPLLTDGKDGKDVTDLTPEEVFNALTDHGRIQGIKMEGDSLYINATYINSGTLTGDLIRGGTIDGVIFTSTANGYMNWTLNQVNPIGESYIMGLNLSAGAINGYTYSNDEPFLTYGYSTNNQSSIRFNFPFSESGVRNYYAFGLESNNAICLKAPTLYIWNRDEETSSGTVSRFDMGMTGSVNIVTNEIVYIGGLPQQRVITLVFNMGIMVAALG